MVEYRTKIEIRSSDTLMYGLSSRLVDQYLQIFLPTDIPNGEYEFYFSYTDYLIRFSGTIHQSQRNIYQVQIPEKISYKERELRVEVGSENWESMDVFANFGSEKFICFGTLNDISMNGFSIKPLPVFFDKGITVGQALLQIVITINTKRIIIEKALVRNICQERIGFATITIPDHFKKVISDYIISRTSGLKSTVNESAPRVQLVGASRSRIVPSGMPRSLDIPSLSTPAPEPAAVPAAGPVGPAIRPETAKIDDSDDPFRFKDKRVYVLDSTPLACNGFKANFQVVYYPNPVVTKINMLKQEPDLLVTQAFNPNSHTQFKQWLSMVNICKLHQIPIMIIDSTATQESQKKNSLIAFTGAVDLVSRQESVDRNVMLDRLLKVFEKLKTRRRF